MWDREGHRGAHHGSWQGVQWIWKQPAETQSSDIIGKCSNQGTGGSALTPPHPRSPAPSQQWSWVPDAAMGSRLLCYVTLYLLGAGEAWTPWELLRYSHGRNVSNKNRTFFICPDVCTSLQVPPTSEFLCDNTSPCAGHPASLHQERWVTVLRGLCLLPALHRHGSQGLLRT